MNESTRMFLPLVSILSLACNHSAPVPTPEVPTIPRPEIGRPVDQVKVANRNVIFIKDKDGKLLKFTQLAIRYQPPAPEYPAEAKALGIQGIVKVKLTVGPDGIPVQAITETGPAELRVASERFAMQWRFLPALLNDVPQYAYFIVTVPYKLTAPMPNTP